MVFRAGSAGRRFPDGAPAVSCIYKSLASRMIPPLYHETVSFAKHACHSLTPCRVTSPDVTPDHFRIISGATVTVMANQALVEARRMAHLSQDGLAREIRLAGWRHG